MFIFKVEWVLYAFLYEGVRLGYRVARFLVYWKLFFFNRCFFGVWLYVVVCGLVIVFWR